MPIQDDINQILHAQSGEAVRGAIVNAIQDLNQNGGNAQTLNGHYSDEFTKNAEFQKFIDDEVGQVHVVLDAINKGITLRVIELGTKWIGPEAGTELIQVPESVKDRQLLTVDDFYADIVEVASGTGSNAHWEKTDYYDTSDCTYTYSHGALASAIKLHFYAKRASATAVQDYNVHEFPDVVDMNATYEAPAGEAYNKFTVNVDVPVLQQEKIVSLSSSETIVPDPDYDAMESVQVNIESPSLEQGGVVVNQATYDQTFTPTSPNVGFSEFRVQANVQFNTQAEEVRISDAEFEDITVTPDSLHAGLSQVTIVNDMVLEEVTVSQNGDVTPGPGYTALKKVTVQVPTPTPRLQEKTVTQNGDVTADANFDGLSTVHVQVSGGGGNWTETDQATWDAMSYEAKKLQGPTVIKNTSHQTSGYWIDLSVAIVMILGEYCDKLPATVPVPKQKYAHLIYFQSKWNYNGWDNSVINHSNISYASMSSGNETIPNGAGGAITNKMLAILHDVTAGDNAEISFSIGAGGYDIDDAAFAVAIPFNSEVDILAEHFSSSSEIIDTSYTLVTPAGNEDPSSEGWYEIVNDVYTLTADTTVTSGKRYYRYANSDYDYVLIIATKWRYGQTSSNGTYSISSGTLVQNGDMKITIGGADKPALALYSDVRSGTTITLGNLLSGSQDSVVVMGINEIFASLYLPYSSLNNIICEAHIDNFDPTAYIWGNGNNPFTLTNLLTANVDGKGVDVNGKAQQDYVYCDLGSTNANFTAYLVFKYTVEYGYGRVLSTSYHQTTGEAAYIAEDGLTMLRAGLWGDDPRFGNAHTIGDYIVVAMRNNNKTMSFFKNSIKGIDKTATNIGRYVALATDYPNGNAYGTNITVAYAGVVNEAESDNVILQNINNLMTKFNIL